MNINRILLFVFMVLFGLCGCANGYKDFYKPNVNQNLGEVDLLDYGRQPVLIGSADIDREIDNLHAKNFRIIGSSFFNGKLHGSEQLIEQAINVRSTHVIYSFKYLTNEMATIPLVTPNGIGGLNVAPIITQNMRYDHAAVFFAKNKNKPRFGILAEELNPDSRKKYGTNKGVLVKSVIEDSPAFNANLFKNDVIISINDIPTANLNGFAEATGSVKFDVESVMVVVLRDSERLELLLKMK